jgi:hypothetical protein
MKQDKLVLMLLPVAFLLAAFMVVAAAITA